MSTGIWVAVVLAVGTYALKAAGPLVLGNRTLPLPLERVATLAPAALLAALVVVAGVAHGSRLTLDARAVGLIVAAGVLWRRGGFLVVVLSAVAATAVARLAGLN